VIAIDVKGGQIEGVRTKDGYIATHTVVNATGPYAGVLGKMAGVDVPVVPLRRFIWTTKPFDQAPSRWTLIIDFSTGFYFHRESGGVLFGMGNRDEGPTFDLSVDWNFSTRSWRSLSTAFRRLEKPLSRIHGRAAMRRRRMRIRFSGAIRICRGLCLRMDSAVTASSTRREWDSSLPKRFWTGKPTP